VQVNWEMQNSRRMRPTRKRSSIDSWLPQKDIKRHDGIRRTLISLSSRHCLQMSFFMSERSVFYNYERFAKSARKTRGCN
jgi:hypothetical protein